MTDMKTDPKNLGERTQTTHQPPRPSSGCLFKRTKYHRKVPRRRFSYPLAQSDPPKNRGGRPGSRGETSPTEPPPKTETKSMKKLTGGRVRVCAIRTRKNEWAKHHRVMVETQMGGNGKHRVASITNQREDEENVCVEGKVGRQGSEWGFTAVRGRCGERERIGGSKEKWTRAVHSSRKRGKEKRNKRRSKGKK